MIAAAGFLIGSIPTGLWLARAAGVNVRGAGSGNIGATNVARTAGARIGALTLLGDFAKGALPVAVAAWLGLEDGPLAFLALLLIAGHIFSVFAGFRGGKGVATAAGAFAPLAPAALGAALVAFALVTLFTRIVSAASIAAAVVLPAAAAAFGAPVPTVRAAILAAILIIVAHRENIVRLLRGEESAFRAAQRG